MSDLLGSQDISIPEILTICVEKWVFQHPLSISLKMLTSGDWRNIAITLKTLRLEPIIYARLWVSTETD
jgi:hypothetical protein